MNSRYSSARTAAFRMASTPACPFLGGREKKTLNRVHHSYHVDLCVGMAHVANNAAVLHAVQVFSGYHIFVTLIKERQMFAMARTSHLKCFGFSSHSVLFFYF